MSINTAKNAAILEEVLAMVRRSVKQSMRMLLVAAATVVAMALVAVPASADSISFQSFSGDVSDSAGQPVRQAGAHPDVLVSFRVPQATPGVLVDEPHRMIVDTPSGLVGNPRAVEACSEMAMTAGQGGKAAYCPVESQVGIAQIFGTGGSSLQTAPVFNIERPDDAPALFAFNYLGVIVKLRPSVRPDDYGITIDSGILSKALKTAGADVTLWGVPADTSHDRFRAVPGVSALTCVLPGMPCSGGGQTVSSTPRPFLSLGTQCTGEPQVTRGHLDGWADIGNFASASFDADKNDVPMTLTGCDRLRFNPSIDVATRSRAAAAPTGLEVDLRVPQSDTATGLAAAHVKDVTMVLPKGVSVAPGSAAGLGACSPAEIGLGSDAAADCPRSSKLGTVSVESPLLDEPMTGDVILATPDANPFGSLIALYIVAEGSGVRVKLPGRVDLDPDSGQVTATFRNNPQLPFSALKVRLDGGPNASLSTPSECGRYETQTTITSWSGKTVDLSSPMVIDQNCAPRGFDPGFLAGVDNPSAGESSTLSVVLSRSDRDQEFRSVRELRMPEGLLGRLSAVELCPAAAADLGNCPEASRIGRVMVAAGVGPEPVWVPEKQDTIAPVYLTEKYRGGAFGLSVVVPAEAGPFNLGRVVDRLSLHVDERTAQLSVREEQSRVFGRDGLLAEVNEASMPRILEGVPLGVRELRVVADRENFMVNPTDCTPQQIAADIQSQQGTMAAVSTRFRASDCARLDFAPRFRAKILDKGRKSTLRSFHPRTQFTVAPRKGDANIGGARVVLPSSTLLDQANIGTTCTRAQMAERACPEKSIVGYAKAWSPLLNRAVEGPVYLAANGGVRPLPDLVAVLDGEIRVVLQGEIATQRSGGKARLQNTFRVVPDAPVSRFVLTMRGGKNRGLLVNSTDLCRSKERGVAVFQGQNGKAHRLRPRIATTFRGCTKVRRQASRKATRQQAAPAAARR